MRSFFQKMKNSDKQTLVITRLTALWALSESALGGIMHALHIPFTGIFVGGMAIICISFIAIYAQSVFGEIIKSTLLVLMVKAGVSPHTPVPAYVAVSFQGLLGATIFTFLRNFRLSAVLFGCLAITESAIQKFLFTTLVFGKSVWVALDIFVASVLHDLGLPKNFSFSFWMVSLYILLYAVFGFILGMFIGDMPNALEKIQRDKIRPQSLGKQEDPAIKRKKSWLRFLWIIGFVFLIFLAECKINHAFYVVLRSLSVTMLLFVVIRPLIVYLINRSAKNKKEEIIIILNLLPEIRAYVKPAYEQSSATYNGMKKYSHFVLLLIHFTISDKTDA